MIKTFALIGTTASGKSSLALEIAKEFDLVILSLDSLCIYKDIDIASAKPSKTELNQVRHFGINLKRVDEEFSVGDFIKEYKNALNFAKKNNKSLLITGGSSFYLKTLLSGLIPKIEQVKPISNEEIYDLIIKFDKEFGQKFSINDTFRLRKWYSIFKQTGEIPSIFLKNNTLEPIIKDIEIFDIFWDKLSLEKRIRARTKDMIKNGLLQEARELFLKFDPNLKPLKSIGLKECKEFLDKKINLDELEELINIHTRQLAKRQRTFNKCFKRHYLDISSTKENIRKFLSS